MMTSIINKISIIHAFTVTCKYVVLLWKTNTAVLFLWNGLNSYSTNWINNKKCISFGQGSLKIYFLIFFNAVLLNKTKVIEYKNMKIGTLNHLLSCLNLWNLPLIITSAKITAFTSISSWKTYLTTFAHFRKITNAAFYSDMEITTK